MEKWTIPQVLGSYSAENGALVVSFVAEDWRKRGGQLRLTIKGIPKKSFVDEVTAMRDVEIVIFEDEQMTTVKSCQAGEFIKVLGRLLGLLSLGWEIEPSNLYVSEVKTLQYAMVDGEETPYERVMEQELLAAASEPHIQRYLMKVAQAAQRLSFLYYHYRQVSPESFPLSANLVEAPLIALVQKVKVDIGELGGAALAKLERDEDYSRYGGMLGSFLCECRIGKLDEYVIEKVSRPLVAYVRFICTKYGVDPKPYLAASRDNFC